MKMTWLHKFLGLFFIPSEGPTAYFNGAAIPPPIFSMVNLRRVGGQDLVKSDPRICWMTHARSHVLPIGFSTKNCQHNSNAVGSKNEVLAV